MSDRLFILLLHHNYSVNEKTTKLYHLFNIIFFVRADLRLYLVSPRYSQPNRSYHQRYMRTFWYNVLLQDRKRSLTTTVLQRSDVVAQYVTCCDAKLSQNCVMQITQFYSLDVVAQEKQICVLFNTFYSRRKT